ncbi:unnamed protein product [Ixodes hexagonus]
MGAYSQLKLVLWKNVVLRLRQPVILALELLWPVTIFLLVLLLRKIVPPISQETCYYNARALPSAGGLPVLQSLICNVDNKCLNKSMYEEIPSYPGSRVNELVHNLSPLVKNENILSVIKALPVLADILRPLGTLFDDEDIQKLLGKYETGLPFTDVLSNTRRARSILVKETNMTSETAQQLLESNINVPAVLNFLGKLPSAIPLECNLKTLRTFIIVKDGDDLQTLVQSLCTIGDESMKNLIQQFQSSIDYGKIVDLVANAVAKLGRSDVGLAVKQVASMISALTSITSEIPADFAASVESLRNLIADFTTGGFNAKILKNIWDDVADTVPSSKRKIADTVFKWLASGFGYDGSKRTTSNDLPPRSLHVLDEGFTEDVLKSAVDLANSLSTEASGSRTSRFLEAILGLNGSASLSHVLETLNELLSYNDGSQRISARRQQALFFSGRLFATAVEFILSDIKKSEETGVRPFFPHMLENLMATISVPSRVNRLLPRGIVNTVCNPMRFKAVFITQVHSGSLQNFTCHLFRDILPALLKTFHGPTNATTAEPGAWDPLSVPMTDIAAFFDKITSVEKPNYEWSTLARTADTFRAMWQSKESNDRIGLSMKLSQITSDYLSSQKLKYWNDFLAVFYMADQMAHLMNQQLEGVLKEGNILVRHVALEVSSLEAIISDLLGFLPDFIRMGLNVLQTDLGPLVEKLEQNRLRRFYVPCQVGTFADLLSVENTDVLRKLEQRICQQVPLLMTQFFQEPHVAAISKMVQDVNHGKEASVNWVAAGSHMVALLNSIERVKRFSGSVFPDVPSLHGVAMKGALEDARTRIGIDDTPQSKTTTVLQLVSVAVEELDATLNHTLAPYLMSMASFLSSSNDTQANLQDRRETSVTEIFRSATEVEQLVRWANNYFVKLLEIFFNTLATEPRKISRIFKQKDGIEVLCSNDVESYLSVPPDEKELTTSAILELCAINFTEVYNTLKASNNYTEVPIQRQTDWFFKTLQHILDAVHNKKMPRMASQMLNGTQWHHFIGHNFWDSRSAANRLKVLSVLKGVTIVFEDNTSALTSIYTAASNIACKLKSPFRNLKWNRLFEHNIDRMNIYSILKLVNGSIDIMSTVFDTLLEPPLIKRIVQDFGMSANGLGQFCSLQLKEWNKYFALDKQDTTFPKENIRHLTCKFNPAKFVEELKPNCHEALQVDVRDVRTETGFYEASLAVYDELAKSFRSDTIRGIRVLDGEEWHQAFLGLQHRLRNGLIKMNLEKLESWITLFTRQFLGEKSPQSTTRTLGLIKYWTEELTRRYKGKFFENGFTECIFLTGSSAISMETAFREKPNVMSFLVTWLPMLPMATESLMSSLLVHRKSEVPPTDLLRIQERVCEKWNPESLTSGDLRQSLFAAVICRSDFTAISRELMTDGVDMQLDSVDALESRNTVMSLFSLLRRITAQLGTLTSPKNTFHKYRGFMLDPWETLNVYNALLGADVNMGPPSIEMGIQTLLQWKQSLNLPDSKTAWETINIFMKSVLERMRKKESTEELLEHMKKFHDYTLFMSQGQTEGKNNRSCILLIYYITYVTTSKYFRLEFGWSNTSSDESIRADIKSIVSLSEDIATGYSSNRSTSVRLLNEEGLVGTVLGFLADYANRPIHSAIRLLLSTSWMVHRSARNFHSWNAIVPPFLEAAEHFNAYIERVPAKNAFVGDATERLCPTCEDPDIVKEEESYLREIVSGTYRLKPQPRRIVKLALTLLNMTNNHSCNGDYNTTALDRVLDVVAASLRNFPDPEELVCALPNKTLADAYRWISNKLRLQDVARSVSANNNSTAPAMSCASIPGIFAEAANIVGKYVAIFLDGEKHKLLEPCLQELRHGPLKDSAHRHFAVVSHVLEFARGLFKRDSSNQTLLNFLVNKLMSQLPAYARMSEVFHVELLKETLDKDRTAYDTLIFDRLMNSKINLNWLVRHNFSETSLLDALCSQTDRYLFLSEVHDIKEGVCNRKLANAAVKFIQRPAEIYARVLQQQKESFLSGHWLRDTLSDANSLWSWISELLSSSTTVSFNGSDGSLISKLSSIVAMLNEDILGRIIKNLDRIQIKVATIFAGGSITEYLNLVLEGFEGLSKLQKARLFDLTYTVKDIFVDKNEAKNIFKRELNMPSEKIDKLLETSLDLALFLTSGNYSDITNALFCNGTAAVSMPHNGTLKSTADFCLSGQSGLYRPLPQLVTSKLLKNFADIAFEGILQTSSLSRQMVKSAFGDLGTAPKVVPEIRHKLSLLASTLDQRTSKALSKLNISQDGISVLTSPSALKLVGKMLCGTPLKALQQQFHLLGASPREPTLDVRETEELPSQFCRRGYEQVMRLSGGPIIWGFLKPILRGQILYSPKTPAALQVMQQINKTFDSMSVIIDALHAWSEATAGLKFLTKKDSVLSKLKAIVTSESLESVLADALGSDMQMFLKELNIGELRREFGDLGGLLDMVQLVGSISQCFDLDRLVGFDDETALEKAAKRLSAQRQFIAAVVFLNLDGERSTTFSSGSKAVLALPPVVHYKLRMDIDNVPLTRTVRSRFWKPGARDDFLDDMRYLRGFAHFQELVDRAIIALHTGDDLSRYPASYIQQFPYPCYVRDTVGYYIKAMLPLVFTLSWIFLVAFFVRERVLPRELHLEEIMQVMGLRPWVDWTAWFLTCITISIAVVLFNTIILSYGGVLPNSDPSLLLVFYATFALSVLAYCHLVSVFFHTATVASLTGIVGYLVSFLPFVIAVSMEANLKLVHKLLLCLSMSTSFSYGCLYVSRLEEQGLGAQWGTLWESPVPGDSMNFGYCIATMLLDSVIYLLVAFVVSSVFQRNKIFQTPWYSCFLFWKPRPRKLYCLSSYLGVDLKSQLSYAACEWPGQKSTAATGIAIKNLSVTYNAGKPTERMAVSHLSLDFEEGHINTLLGQNGAGKTTTIKVLTGQYSPTSGDVFIYGRNITDERAEFRKYLGYCPQYNTLYGKMTVKEHLIFFGNLKGLMSPKEVEEDVEKMLKQMSLAHMKDEQACHLSGGLQRRLCVAFSFIGGSKLVILDEPTSSVDPMARRNIWDLILKYKHDRTILLTTHHMDEADVLSDKVAIIHKGCLLCDGSPLVLKSKFGCGYQLSLTRSSSEPTADSDSGHSSNISRTSADDDITDLQGILKAIRSVVPLAQVASDHGGGEVVISLPQRHPTKNTLYPFSELISLLDERMLEFGFGTYGFSSTTLEEVFLSLCAVCDAEYSPKAAAQSLESLSRAAMMRLHEKLDRTDSKDTPVTQGDNGLSVSVGRGLAGSALKKSQFKALLLKRLYHTVNNWKAIFFSIVLPCIFIALAMGFTLIVPIPLPEPSLRLTTQLYGPGATAFISETPPTPVSRRLLSPPGIGPSCLGKNRANSQCGTWLSEGKSKKPVLKGKLQSTCDLPDVKQQLSSAPRTTSETSDVTYNVSGLDISDHLLGSYSAFIEKRYGGWSFEKKYVKVWYDNTGYHALPAYQNALSNAILRTMISNSSSPLDPSSVGITVYNHPLHLSSDQLGKETIVSHVAEVGIAIVILMGLSFIPSRVVVYVVNERIRDEKQVQSISGVGPLLYWTTAFIWDMGLVISAVLLSCLIIVAFGLPVYVSKLNFPAVVLLMVLFGWGATPLMYCLSRLFKEASISFVVLYCVNLFIGLNIAIVILVLNVVQFSFKDERILSAVQNMALMFPQYALIGGLVSLTKNQIQADVYQRFGQDTYESPFSERLLAYNYCAMFLVGVFCFCVNLVLEYHFIRGQKPKTKERRCSNLNEDCDVSAERLRTTGDAGKHDVLRVMDVVKVYHEGYKAVNNVSFGIPKGECFGLLGVNGAGKTTLFRILTGQLRPTKGGAYIQDKSLAKVFSKGIQLVGYCPQADALDDLLSPRQHLVIYAMMRGIPESRMKLVVEEALARFQLTLYSDHRVGTLSRGTRRKVCTAISMLGDPQLVLLDEPTSGMDPVTRRLVWANVSEAVRDKRSVLLTSHSMAECDLLCSRLAIMVNGKLCCVGSPQYLKHKFGAGYTVTLRMVENPTDWERIIGFIRSSFPTASLKAHHYNIVEFSLPLKQVTLASVFKFLEMNGNKLGILDFSVSQTTLDQVFVNFARQQSDESAVAAGQDEVVAGTSTQEQQAHAAKEEFSGVEVVTPQPQGLHECECHREATKL